MKMNRSVRTMENLNSSYKFPINQPPCFQRKHKSMMAFKLMEWPIRRIFRKAQLVT